MTADKILTRTFADHEQLAPDPEATLAGVLDRVGRPHRRTGPVLAVAAATVAVVAGTAVVLDRPAPDPAPNPAASRPSATASATAPAPAPTAATLAAGWLPPGQVESVVAAVGFGELTHGYQVTPASGPGLYVLLRTLPGTALPTENKRGQAVDLTVGGRPAREWAVRDWYTLAVLRPGGTVATVDLSADSDKGHVEAAALAAIGRRVAAGLDPDRLEPMDTSYTLSVLPAGTAVRSVSVAGGGETRYVLAGPAGTAVRPGPGAVEVTEQPEVWSTAIGKPRPPAHRGEPVLGRPTYVTDTGELWVDGIRPGRSVVVSPADRATTLADLYRVARGIRWTG